ncbi:hypothetical protein, conserved [Cyanidioschyzon merolae strain 10D]|uniref:Pru domain-containing protein n=1 Tax=Cyanidioschyzon merolae (strain NIES-3377 / 10D) TaxID=280699 RepID=M1V885_CYAM1|nr:hypothetical protein, conserved [Cyanidioschyzon merolae strain 10D]BAM80404.1 hypothetical protein, conserved [Cyanidioschyzon merolae strain 10D]|eukprot:XP_005535011.1 hypothetical protein, conserved [Cyanidioschyzon merolae strain 10D]
MDELPEQVLVEFRAGRAYLDSGLVHSDGRKGCVRVVRAADGLVHFQWLDRATRAIEEDLIVLPRRRDRGIPSRSRPCRPCKTMHWRRVHACRTGRMFVLGFASSDLQLFFWLQEPRCDADVRLAQRLRNALECRPLDDPAGLDHADEVRLSDAESRPGPGLSSQVPDGATRPSSAALGQSLVDALQRLGASAASDAVHAADDASRQPQARADDTPDLGALLRWGPALERLLREPGLGPASAALCREYLPSSIDLESVLQSAAFRQQLEALSTALRRSRGDAGPLFAAFGIEPPPAGDWRHDLEALLEALRLRAEESARSRSEGPAPESRHGCGR